MILSKSVGLLIGILLICLFAGCSILPKSPQPSDVKNWPMATSAGRLGRLDEAALIELKEAGFDGIEIGLFPTRDMTSPIAPSPEAHRRHSGGGLPCQK